MISPIDNYEFPSSLLAAYTVCQAQNRNVVVRVMNTSNINVELQAGQKICEFYPLVKTYSPDLFHTSEHQVSINCGTLSSNKLASQLAFQFDPSISDQAKESLLQTLWQYPDVFDEGLGHNSVVEHSIDTGSSPPIHQYPRRLPYAYREETKAAFTRGQPNIWSVKYLVT